MMHERIEQHVLSHEEHVELARINAIPSTQVKHMIEAHDCEAFRRAAKNGHLAIIDQLVALAPDDVQKMVTAYNYEAFRKAAANGHLTVMDRSMTLAPDKVQQMIEANWYEAFRNAAANGHLAVIEQLMTKLAPNTVRIMIQENDYEAFRRAAANGHCIIMQRLITELGALYYVQEMISARQYEALRKASQHNHQSAIAFLLSFTFLFAYAEQHVHEFGAIVQPYIESTLIHLRQRKLAFEMENPHGVFDVNALHETPRYYLMIRHLIRTQGNLDDIQFFLSIPAVKARVANNNNELLRLALTVTNQAAAALLLMFPDVHTLAQANDYYRNELGGRVDLAELARDRESSMRALTPGEQAILNKAIQFYKPRIIQQGAAVIINELRTQLAERFMTSGTNLPLTWDEFNQLNLSPQERQRALATYYKNPDHTAWRYLQKPNLWMNARASYVYVNPDATHERWSTFEEYLPEIALMYLGASDANQPSPDGFSVVSRFEHFISELALINRAHNWDNTRRKRGANGELRTEEFDDLEGDRPSCYSGVKRRLFQSVLAHPLFKLVRLDDIKQMLASRMREHFQQFITDDNRRQLDNAWRVVLKLTDSDDMTEKDARECLAALNLPKQTQEEWLATQQGVHAAFFELNPNFTPYIQQQFQLTEQFPTHAERFGGSANLTDLLSITTEEYDNEENAALRSGPKR